MNSRKHFVGRVVVATASRATLKEPTAGSQSDKIRSGGGWPALGVLYPSAHPRLSPNGVQLHRVRWAGASRRENFGGFGDRGEIVFDSCSTKA